MVFAQILIGYPDLGKNRESERFSERRIGASFTGLRSGFVVEIDEGVADMW